VPKHVKTVRLTPRISPFSGQLSTFTRDGVEYVKDEVGSTLAHELAHSVSVPHHGESDPATRRWTRDTSVNPPVIREYEFAADERGVPETTTLKPGAGKVIQVYVEGANAYVQLRAHNPLFDRPMNLWLAARGGQHSGDEACFMRYDCAHAYVHPRNAGWRVLTLDPEVTGETLCESKEGTGVNDATRKPAPRYRCPSGRDARSRSERSRRSVAVEAVHHPAADRQQRAQHAAGGHRGLEELHQQLWLEMK
jgi:hypothetical protein